MQAIVAAALEVLSETGNASQLSLRAVATRAKLSLGTIQYYYATKAELLEACLDGFHGRVAELALSHIQIAQESQDGKRFFEDAIRAFYDLCVRERALIRLRLVANLDQGELHPRRQADFMRSLLTQAVGTVKHLIEVPEQEARVAIQAMTAILIRFALLSDSEREHFEGPEAIVEYLIRVGRRMVRPGDG